MSTRKIILSGGPHTGKTTLLNRLRGELGSGVHFVPEPAELIITEELARASREPGYKAIVPTQHYTDFVGLVVARSVVLESAIPKDAKVAVLDRSLVDNIGYARLNGHDHLVPDLARMVEAAGYTTAILCDFVGTYTPTDVRPETWEHAQAIHAHLLQAYAEVGLDVVHLPPVDVDARVAMALNVIYPS